MDSHVETCKTNVIIVRANFHEKASDVSQGTDGAQEPPTQRQKVVRFPTIEIFRRSQRRSSIHEHAPDCAKHLCFRRQITFNCAAEAYLYFSLQLIILYRNRVKCELNDGNKLSTEHQNQNNDFFIFQFFNGTLKSINHDESYERNAFQSSSFSSQLLSWEKSFVQNEKSE